MNGSFARILIVVVVLSLLAASRTPAQNGSQFTNWTPPSREAHLEPKVTCGALRSLTGYEFSVITATNVTGTSDAPGHCRVSGQILPEIRFEVNLPASWNRRLYMFGNGGFAGEPFDADGRVLHRNSALQHGFAVAATNTGHDLAAEPLATFATNRQKLIDYAFRAVHTTADTAKKLVRAYYGEPQSRAYFDGCSTGGRQGLISAQRFPQDFDGIVVGAPVLNFSGTMVSYAWIIRALADAPIPTAKLKNLAERIYARCDENDGLKDGLVDDPRNCEFMPSRDLTKCSGDSDGADCFTNKQIGALEKIYADVPSQGERFFPGWPVSAEIEADGRSGWDGWLVRDTGRPRSVLFSESFFRYMGFPETVPNYDLAGFDFDKDPARLNWISQVLDATDPDLSQFQSHGGKIIMYYGWADPALNARMGVEYYEKVAKRMSSSTTRFFRLFMVPGMFHCRGGVGVSSFDAMTPLVTWVEKGEAPERITGARIVEGKTVRTRPLCPYPQVARYKGSGGIDDAANFVCLQP
jgi:feruloyl esterase